MEPLPANPPEEAFVAVLDVLRENRRTRAADPDRDRPFLAQLDALYDVLDEAATERVDALWWRGWPDLYDRKVQSLATERLPDPADSATWEGPLRV